MLVDDLVTALRDQLDERNSADLGSATLLRALNRGQQKLVRLAGRKYEAVFRQETTLTTDGTRELTIPSGAFGLVIDEVAVQSSNAWTPVTAVESRDTVEIDQSNSTSAIPTLYVQQGNKLRLFPLPPSGISVRVRYQSRPPELVLSQGRITSLVEAQSGSPALYLDALGTGLTTSVAALGAFVNVVDPVTGLVKATLQVSALDTTNVKATFKTTSLDRTTVFGQTVAAAVPTTVALDDLVCLANGTCVPTLLADYADFLVQFATVELKRKSGEDVQAELIALGELTDDVKAMWAGRQATLRVQRTSPFWGRRTSLLNRYS